MAEPTVICSGCERIITPKAQRFVGPDFVVCRKCYDRAIALQQQKREREERERQRIAAEEKCTACSRTITARMNRYILGKDLLCRKCYLRAIDRVEWEKRERERAEAIADGRINADTDPPTSAQLKFAEVLGIDVNPSMTKWHLIAAIDAALDQKQEARMKKQYLDSEETKVTPEFD